MLFRIQDIYQNKTSDINALTKNFFFFLLIDNKSEILDMVHDYKTTDNSFFVADTQSDDSPKVGWNFFFLCLATKSDYLFSFIYRDAVSLFSHRFYTWGKLSNALLEIHYAMQRMSSVIWKTCRKIFFPNFPDKTISNSYLPISDLLIFI